MMNNNETTISINFNQFNYLAIKLLEYLDNLAPTQAQIDLIEDLLSTATIKQRICFDDTLNSTEIACLFWASRGKSSKEMERLLKVSQANIKSMRKQIKRKLNCFSMAQAVFEGIRFGYI